MQKLWLPILLLLLAACDLTGQPSQPLVVVATPVPPSAGFDRYQHPTGVFSIRVPPQWIPDELPDSSGLRMQFTSAEGTERAVRLSIYVVNTGQPLTADAFLQAANSYLPDDVSAVPWTPLEAPIAMGDGSLRVTGIRHYPTLGDRALNIFMQSNGSYFTVLEIDVTGVSLELARQLMAAVNTYRIDTSVALSVGNITPPGGTSESGVIGFRNFLHWQDSGGGFNITGQIVNLADAPFEAVRLTAYLYDSEGNQLAERSDILGYDVLAAGEAAPFRIRFDTGRPSTAVRYELNAAARAAEFSLARFYGNVNFVVANDDAFYSDNTGYLTVTGLLQNNGARIATSVKVIVTLFNAAGEVVAVETSFVNKEQLLPGEATPFEITFHDLGGDPLRYNIVAQGTTPQ